MNHHIIYRQKATVTVAQEVDAYAVQNEISDAIKNDLPQLLQEVFDSLVPESRIIRIDTLQLNLGTLPVQSMKQAFKERIIEKITEAILEKKENAFPENGVDVIRKEESSREALLYFLQQGSMPWFLHGKKRSEWESEMQQGFAKADWQKMIAWLQQNSQQQPLIIERLVHQFSDDFIEVIIDNAISFGDETWKEIYQDLLTLFTKEKRERAQLISLCLASFLKEKTVHGALCQVVKNSLKRDDAKVYNSYSVSGKIITTKAVSEVFKTLMGDARPSIKRYDEDGISQPSLSDENVTGADEVEKPFSFQSDHTSSEKRQPGSSEVEKEPRYVSNCGIVLLHPFLEMYFAEFDLLNKRKFINDDACKRAVLLLHYLATGNTEGEEWNLGLQKMMCGLSFDETLPNQIELTDKEKEESERMLQSFINYCPPLKNTSLAGLRSTFLQRDGRLDKKENGWRLTVEQKTVDVLLDKIPWGFSTLKFSWLADMITVDWC